MDLQLRGGRGREVDAVGVGLGGSGRGREHRGSSVRARSLAMVVDGRERGLVGRERGDEGLDVMLGGAAGVGAGVSEPGGHEGDLTRVQIHGLSAEGEGITC